jgi:hypothetical protein
MSLLSYISIPITNKNKTHTVRIDLNTNFMYYKNNEGNYILIDDLHQIAQDASTAINDDEDMIEDESNDDSNMDPNEIIELCQKELDLILNSKNITSEQSKRKVELEELIEDFKSHHLS